MRNPMLPAAITAIAMSMVANGASAPYSYAREYRVGSQLDYVLATRVLHNGKPASNSVAVAHDAVVSRSGVPFDRVTFRHLKECSGSGSAKCKILDSYASEVAPVYVSLAAHGTISMPRLKVSEMTGTVTDFVTFWVAMSAKMGIAKLHRPGDHLLVPAPILGSWANAGSIPLGRDYLAVAQQLVSMTPDTVTFRTSFRPPDQHGLAMAQAWMQTPVSGSTPNNFEQLIEQGKAGATVMWGHEKFTITTTVRRTSGVILEAQMENELDLQMRMGCTSDADHCGPAMPFTVTRHETLRLIPDSHAAGSDRSGT